MLYLPYVQSMYSLRRAIFQMSGKRARQNHDGKGGEPMSLEAIKAIRGVEGSADQAGADARAKAAKMIADAEREGKELLAQEKARSAEKTAEVMKRAEAEAEGRRKAILTQAEAEAQALRSQARSKLAQAAKTITGRVVES